MRFDSVILLLVIFCLLVITPAQARTRVPKTDNERSLLYWRYLCENQPQSETVKTDHAPSSPIELVCPAQGWKVHADGDQVREVVEDAKK